MICKPLKIFFASLLISVASLSQQHTILSNNLLDYPDSTIHRNGKKKDVLVEEQDEETKRIQFGIGGGVLFAFKSKNYDSGTGGNLFLEFRSTIPISIRANIGWYSADTRGDYLSAGNSSFVFMELSLLGRAMSGVLQPYGGLGFGYYSIDNSLDDEVTQYFNWLGFGVSEQIEDGVGFHIRGGFDLIFESYFGLFIDMKYWIYNPETTASEYPLGEPFEGSTVKKEIQLTNLNLILGVTIIL
jgi:hypothetical protein